MLEDISQVIRYLHLGSREKAEPFFHDLKIRAIYLDDRIQRDVLTFVEQVCFQYAYDPWHKVTPEVQKAADHLIDSLGFTIHQRAG